MALTYLSGFGNHFSSEAIPGALPLEQNSPQVHPKGLYAEQLSGSAFTAPRANNLATWLYRIKPSVQHQPFESMEELTEKTFFKPRFSNPNQLRWNPMSAAKTSQDFLEGIRTLIGTGSVQEQKGLQIHLYSFNRAMTQRFFMNADGDFLIIPQTGSLQVRTELGILEVRPGEIVLVPRGMKFQVRPGGGDQLCTGYVGENFGAPFRLPELGVIGANGLAHPRHFLTPVAAFEDLNGTFELVGKFNGELWTSELDHSPLDVVAWHGNYVPYKYDLHQFNTINTVSFDHPDPSIFTVLTSPSDTTGIANVDFAIFPPRWMVAEHTFRPPYFHRNCMSEYMGLIEGAYDAKAEGFSPGGGSLHNVYSAHGPDKETFEKASKAHLKPHKIENTMAFMFESRSPYLLTEFALKGGLLQKDYSEVWQNFPHTFK
jgi:homogentisate 1,2-dioxygenase